MIAPSVENIEKFEPNSKKMEENNSGLIEDEELISKTITFTHNLGHNGPSAMINYIRFILGFNIKNLSKRCIESCKNCESCQLINDKRAEMNMLTLYKSNYPLEKICINIFFI